MGERISSTDYELLSCVPSGPLLQQPVFVLEKYTMATQPIDEAMDAIIKSRQMPNVPVNFVPAQAGEIIKLGPITCRVLEDGSRTGEESA